MKDAVEYPDYFARFYDLIYHTVRSETDTGYYLEQIKACKGKVLEIGSGTGRLFIDALNAGADIYGIDISKSMTDVLKSKLLEEVHNRIMNGDACSMKLEQKFDLILAPFRVFSHVLDTKDQTAFLNNVYDHLTDSGEFILDLFIPDPVMLANGIYDEVDFEGEYEPGKKMRRIVTSIPDIVNQLLDITMRFEWDENGTLLSKSWKLKMRFFFRYELEYLIKSSKLHLKKIYGNFNGASLDKDSREFVTVCSRS